MKRRDFLQTILSSVVMVKVKAAHAAADASGHDTSGHDRTTTKMPTYPGQRVAVEVIELDISRINNLKPIRKGIIKIRKNGV